MQTSHSPNGGGGTAEPLLPLSSFPRPPRRNRLAKTRAASTHPTANRIRRRTPPQSQTEHTGGSTPGSGKRRHRSETGTFGVQTWSAPEAPRGWRARHTHMPVGKGMQHGRQANPFFPGPGRRAKRHGSPTNHSEKCVGIKTGLRPDNRTPGLPHTTPSGGGGEARGPLAEREERPPFTMNVRPSPGAA